MTTSIVYGTKSIKVSNLYDFPLGNGTEVDEEERLGEGGVSAEGLGAGSPHQGPTPQPQGILAN